MTSAEPLLTPKDLAAAIGASESSLRRWIDSGDIRVSRTAGGHRRILLSDAVQFIRKLGAVVVRPDVLNLPGLPQAPTESSGTDSVRLFAALREGQGDVARGLVLAAYLRGDSLAMIFDGPMRSALHELGELWKHDERGILVEHRATEICLSIITALRALLPRADGSAPLAMGGAPQGDPYQIPSSMAATALAEVGLRDVNFGANTPLPLLAGEATRAGARLVWVSVSTADDPKSLRSDVKNLAAALAEQGISLVIGGSASAASGLSAMKDVNTIGSMGELAAFARGLLGGGAAPAAQVVHPG
jgi:excisionase family DNA binding protein